MRKKPPIIRDNTPEEEAAIQKAIAEDPDTWEATGPIRHRGRPKGSNKTRVTLFLDNDVIEKLKSPEAKGWQTRANDALKKAVVG